MHVIRKTYNVEYAHQLRDAYTKECSDTIHGHSGKIEVFFVSDTLDGNDMVIDFGEISGIIKKFIMDIFDHALIVPDSFSKTYLKYLKKYNKKLLVIDRNPTAEYFAESLFWDITNLLKGSLSSNRSISLWKVRFHETETGYAEFQPIESGLSV